MDLADWEVLLRQLEDALALGALLHLAAPRDSPQPPPPAARQPITLSVSKLLDGGRGQG